MAATTTTTTCERCGLHVGHRGRELDLGIDGAITVRRILCAGCLDFALEVAGRALERVLPVSPRELRQLPR